MQANSRTLDTLFNSQLRYVVPMFQRLYVWQEVPQWSTLWEDVTEKANLQLEGKGSNPHYLGALIIEGVRPNSTREVKRFLVIDGQQRLTTLQLLLCAYRDIARKNGWKQLDRETTRYLENADADVMENPEEERFKLWPTALNRAVFGAIISASSRATVEERFPLVRLPRKRNPEPRNNLVEAYLYFSTKIEEWITHAAVNAEKTTEDCASSLLYALKQDFCVVEISLSEGDDSQEIFYSLNSQGRPLSQSDLLRSLVFMRAEKEKLDRDAIFNEYWEKFETQFWSTEINRGGRNYSRLDIALRYFLMAKTGEMVEARRVNEEYRRWIAAQPTRYPTVREELADFSKHTDLYQYYESASQLNLPSTDLRRILLDFDVSTALPLILYLGLDAGLNKQQTTDCLLIVESFIARRVLTGSETKDYNKLFVEIIGSLQGLTSSQVMPALVKKLLSGSGSTRSWPTDKDIIEEVINREIFTELKTPALRLILEQIEIALRSKKSEEMNIPQNLQIEHVLPQSWGKHWPLKGKFIPENTIKHPFLASFESDFEEEEQLIRKRNAQLHTLGNLTLLNKYLNPSASNSSFEIKLVAYKDSVLRINRHFDNQTTWDEECIRQRGEQLGKLLCTIWPIPQ